jgi:hypothetical protein
VIENVRINLVAPRFSVLLILDSLFFHPHNNIFTDVLKLGPDSHTDPQKNVF